MRYQCFMWKSLEEARKALKEAAGGVNSGKGSFAGATVQARDRFNGRSPSFGERTLGGFNRRVEIRFSL
jgi:hypothetical protein